MFLVLQRITRENTSHKLTDAAIDVLLLACLVLKGAKQYHYVLNNSVDGSSYILISLIILSLSTR